MTNQIKKYVTYFTCLTILAVSVVYLTAATKNTSRLVKPKNAAEFASTSVMITNLTENSGGTGVILQSEETESIVMTNKHVCELIQIGGLVKTRIHKYRIYRYKYYKKHDLCLIKIAANLGINTIISATKPDLYSRAFVSGHPSLLPDVLTEGYFSDYKMIDVMVGMVPCDGTEKDQEMLACAFYGEKPVVRKFRSQVVTATIMPGSSGSGVFNDQGEIAGLVFAGSSEGLSYAFIVPLRYLQDFVKHQNRYPWRKPYAKSNKHFFSTSNKKRSQISCITKNRLVSKCIELYEY